MQASERSDLSASLQDFLTVCCPEIGANPKTLGVLPMTTIQQLSEQCAARFEQGNPTSAVTAGTTQSSFLPLVVRISEHQHTSAQMKLFTQQIGSLGFPVGALPALTWGHLSVSRWLQLCGDRLAPTRQPVQSPCD